MTETAVRQSPAHPNAGILLRQIFDFSDTTRAVFHTAVSNRASPSLALMLSLVSVGMRSSVNVVLPGNVPLSLLLVTFTRGAGPTPAVASSLNKAQLEDYGEPVLNPGSTYVVTGVIAEASRDGEAVWIHANQPVRGLTRGHGQLQRIWAEGSGNPSRSHFVTVECYGEFLSKFMSMGKGRLSELFVMCFPSWDCRPEDVYITSPTPGFIMAELPSPDNGIALCPQALSALETGLHGTWNPALVNRVKIAALGALLHGDDYVGEEIWRWAGLVLTHCSRSRNVAEWMVRQRNENIVTDDEVARR